jgi:hypothetical protein
VLIINADDFGMYPSVNSAVLRSIECGLPALAASCRHVLAPANLGLALAEEYRLAARVWLDPSRHTARQLGLPVVDHDFLDSFFARYRDEDEPLAAAAARTASRTE